MQIWGVYFSVTVISFASSPKSEFKKKKKLYLKTYVYALSEIPLTQERNKITVITCMPRSNSNCLKNIFFHICHMHICNSGRMNYLLEYGLWLPSFQ